MDGVTIRVTTQELKGMADVVTSKVSNLKDAIEQTEQLIEKTSAYWLGSAGDAKRKKFRQKKDMTTDMIGRLGEYTTDLLQIAGIYEDVEAKNADIPSALPADVIV